MKKLTSILCALVIALGVNAAPVKNLGRLEKGARVELKDLKSHAIQHKAIKTLNVAPAAEKQMVGEAVRFNKVVRTSKADAVTLQIAVENITSSGAKVTVTASDEVTLYYWDVYETAEVAGKTDEQLAAILKGTIQDAIDYYSYLGSEYAIEDFLVSGEDSYVFESLTDGTAYTVVAMPMDANGAGTGASAKQDFTTPAIETSGKVVTIDFEENGKFSYSSYYGEWTLEAANDTAEVCLDIVSDNAQSAVGEYTTDDFYFYGYTYVKINDNKISAKKASAKVVERNDTLFCNASLIDEAGDEYKVSLFYAAPKKEKEETVTATDLEVNDSYFSWFGIILATASNADYEEIYFSLTPNEEADSYDGTYTIGDNASGSITPTDGDEIEMYSGQITLATSSEGAVLTGKVLCTNNTEYTFNLIYVKPTEPTREESVAIDNGKLAVYSGAWQIMAYNADSTVGVSIAAFADQVAGSYDEEALALDYTAVYYLTNGNATEMFSVIDADLNVTFNAEDSIANITGTMLAQGYVDKTDLPLFTLDITAKIPAPVPPTEQHLDGDTEDEPYNETFDSYEIDDQYLAKYGDIIVKAQNDNGAYVGLDFYIAEGESTLTPGTYAISDSEEPMTLYPGEASGTSIYYSFVSYLDEEGYLDKVWFPVAGTVTVSEDGLIVIDALNSYAQTINVTLKNGEESGVENNTINAKAVKTIENGMIVIKKNGVRYNVLGAELK